jgi:Cft2 family RNA processing exonuclease
MLDTASEFRLAGTDWFLDARQPRDQVVVTHAHSDHIGRHRLCVATPITAAIMKHRLYDADELAGSDTTPADPPAQCIELPVGAIHKDGDVQLELFHAGHVLGSAMVRATTPEGSLLYTGDFRLRDDALTVPACSPVRADTLLMECTYGLARYRFPPRQQVLERLFDLITAAQANGRVPILLCYSLGKAQELTAHLTRNGFSVMLHGAAYAISQIYEQSGIPLGPFERYAAGQLAGQVLIVPPHVRNSRMITAIKNAEIFAITGWALDSSAVYRYQAHHGIPFSDHADFDELNDFVDRVNPKRVLLTHGFVKEMVRHLRSRGLDAHPARPPKQMALFDT